VSHAFHSNIAEFQRSHILGVLVYLCLHPLMQNNQLRQGNTYIGKDMFYEARLASHVIAFAQMRRAVCQPQLSFLF